MKNENKPLSRREHATCWFRAYNSLIIGSRGLVRLASLPLCKGTNSKPFFILVSIQSDTINNNKDLLASYLLPISLGDLFSFGEMNQLSDVRMSSIWLKVVSLFKTNYFNDSVKEMWNANSRQVSTKWSCEVDTTLQIQLV